MNRRLVSNMVLTISVVALVVSLLALAPDGSRPRSIPPLVVTAPALDVGLPVAAELDRSGYDRDLFKHWSDLDGDGCDTREEVLVAEAVVAAVVEAGTCRVLAGSWRSVYDGLVITDPSSVDIDHLVALGEAWDSGAALWDTPRREAFANDVGLDESLVAVSAKSNRAKGDRDPAEWLPPEPSVHCDYARQWVRVKATWALTVDEAEASALARVLARCA